jgi:hypothetical protein
MDRDHPRDLSDLYRAFATHPRQYTAAEERVIAAAARRHEDAAVAKLYLDIARWERGER